MQYTLLCISILLLSARLSHGQLIVSDSSTALVAALDNNVAAVDRMTASNERVVAKLESSIDKMVESNNKNVAQLVDTADRLITKWDTSIGPSIQNALDTWDKSLKPTVDEALHKWDHSVRPQVQQVADIGQGALNRWDESIQPRVDDALRTFDDTLKVVNTSIIGRLDEYTSYGKSVFIPLFFGFGTLWSVMCCFLMPLSCYFWTRKLKKAEFAMMKRAESLQAPDPLGQKSGMYSQFLL